MEHIQVINEDLFCQNLSLGDALNYFKRQKIDSGNILTLQKDQKQLVEKKVVNIQKIMQRVQTQIVREHNIQAKIQIVNDFNKNNSQINNTNTFLDLISESIPLKGAARFYKQPVPDSNELKIVYCIQGITSQQILNPRNLIFNKSTFEVTESYLNQLKQQGCSHIVTEVNYGFRVFIVFSKKNIMPNEQRQLERNILEKLQKDYFKIQVLNGYDFSITNQGNTHMLGSDIEIEVFSDLPVEVSQNNVININNKNYKQNQYPVNVKMTNITQFGGEYSLKQKSFVSDYQYQQILKIYSEISQYHQKIKRKIEDINLLACAVSFEVEDLQYDLQNLSEKNDDIIQKTFKQLLKKEVEKLKLGETEEFNKEQFIKIEKEQKEIQKKVENNLENCDKDIFENIVDMVHNYQLKIIQPNSSKDTQQIVSQFLLKYLNTNNDKNMIVLMGELDSLDIETQKCFKLLLQNQMVDIPNQAREKPQVFYIPQYDTGMQNNNIKILDVLSNSEYVVKVPQKILNNLSKFKKTKCCIQVYDNQANLLKQVFPLNTQNLNLINFESENKFIFGQLCKSTLQILDSQVAYQFYQNSGRIQYIGTFKNEKFEGRGKLYEDNEDQTLIWNGKFIENEGYPQLTMELPEIDGVKVNINNLEDWKQHKRIQTIQFMQDLKNDSNNCKNRCMDDFKGLSFVQFNQFFIIKQEEALCDFCKLQYHKCNKEIADVVYEVNNIEYHTNY